VGVAHVQWICRSHSVAVAGSGCFVPVWACSCSFLWFSLPTDRNSSRFLAQGQISVFLSVRLARQPVSYSCLGSVCRWAGAAKVFRLRHQGLASVSRPGFASRCCLCRSVPTSQIGRLGFCIRSRVLRQKFCRSVFPFASSSKDFSGRLVLGSAAESCGLAWCPASVLLLKDFIFS
jgi:hypothetical protein